MLATAKSSNEDELLTVYRTSYTYFGEFGMFLQVLVTK
jgi:hypothetical protein